MLENYLITLVVVGLLAFVISVRPKTNYNQKRLWYLSWTQILVLVVLPGVLFPMLFSYMQSLVDRPLNQWVWISDKLLVDITLLAMMFTYGGVAIHAVTKMMADYLRRDDSEVARMNRFFHMTLSHNLSYAAGIVVVLGFTLLELNHVPPEGVGNWGWGVLRGVIFGISYILMVKNYTSYVGDNYRGRWSELKVLFMVAWIAFVLCLYVVKRMDQRITEYQLVLPTLLSFSMMVLLSLVLVLRRVKRGWRVLVSQKRLQRIMSLTEDEWS